MDLSELPGLLQPDVIWSGGISECKKIAAMAESKYIDVVLHNPASFSDVGGMASLHIDACTTNCVITESQPNPKGWEADLYYGVTHPIKDGFAELPDKPGLGIEFNEEVWKKHPYEPRERSHNLYDDGSVMDN